ncbi:hypothetical protein E4T50_01124 [Aureobasidium sp. EXF-12298]|nr:hypothetical protein E4T50_01124 [Aureobasidium sp. EXF-12298]
MYQRSEELALTVLRSKGDASEVAIYRALGSLASVRKIHLKMCYSQSFLRKSDPTSQPDMMCAKGQILDQDQETELDDALINIAVDQSLAQSIFRTISTSKPAYSPPLERVSLGVGVMRDFSSSIWSLNLHLYNVLRYIGRSWTCVRNPRDDKLHDCFATGYDPKERISRERLMKRDISLAMPSVVFGLLPRQMTGSKYGIALSSTLLSEPAQCCWFKAGVYTTGEVLKFSQPFCHVFNEGTAHILSHTAVTVPILATARTAACGTETC